MALNATHSVSSSLVSDLVLTDRCVNGPVRNPLRLLCKRTGSDNKVTGCSSYVTVGKWSTRGSRPARQRRAQTRASSSSSSSFPGFPEFLPPFTTGLEGPDAVVNGTEIEGSWVMRPSQGDPSGVIHFLGGAFVGAAPQVSYAALLEGFTDAGYLVVATPFDLTFDHLACARTVAASLDRCLNALNITTAGADADADAAPASAAGREGEAEALPLYAVGHSNGSLIHLLMGSTRSGSGGGGREVQKAALMSFNNKPVEEAVPGGLPPQVGPALAQAQALGDSLSASLASSGLPSTLADLPQPQDPFGRALLPLLEQLDTTLSEVAKGAVEFTPTPEESRRIIAQNYATSQTLLIEFEDDFIDETPEMLELLRTQEERQVERRVLPGAGHVTPLGANVGWEVGAAFTPLDAVGQALKSGNLRQVDTVTKCICQWLQEP